MGPTIEELTEDTISSKLKRCIKGITITNQQQSNGTLVPIVILSHQHFVHADFSLERIICLVMATNCMIYLTFIVSSWYVLSKSLLMRRVRPGKGFNNVEALQHPSQSYKGIGDYFKVSKTKLLCTARDLNKLLFLQGQVTHGYGRGSKSLGVPTANLPHYDKQLQENDIVRGVYYGWVNIYGRNDTEMPCVANIGKSPTFEGHENVVNIVEVHIIGHPFSEDFYGSFIRVALVGFLRPERKFDSLDELVAQINQDVQDASSFCIKAEAALLEKVREYVSSDSMVNICEGTDNLTTVAHVQDDKLGADDSPRNFRAFSAWWRFRRIKPRAYFVGSVSHVKVCRI